MTALGPSPLSSGDLRLEDARLALLAGLGPVTAVEPVPLTQALGRILAADIVSPIDVPAHDNSAMDGYAFAGAALREGEQTVLACAGTVYAGRPFEGQLGAGQCLRIMTGAVMPDGTDTVVPQELCHADGGQVRIEPAVLRAGENRRRRGEDLARGGVALPAGRVLRPADLGLAASLGLATIEVRRRLRVALFSTGDEVRAPGEPLPPGCIYDSNRYSLGAALQRLGVEVVDLGRVPDDPQALQRAFEQAVEQADAVLTSGGVSVGDADYTRELLGRMGEVGFWKVAMRPGRPFAFGALRAPSGRSAWLFALPGNPVAALVTFYVLAREGLLRLAGAQPRPLPAVRLPSAAPIRKRPGRTEIQRARIERAADGRPQVRLTGAQNAGILRSLSEADALVVLGHDQASVAAGDDVEVWLFDSLD